MSTLPTLPGDATSSLRTLRLYAETARHLRLEQWLHWPVRTLRRRVRPLGAIEATWDSARAAALREELLEWRAGGSEASLARADAVMRGSFEFLGRRLDLAQPDWNRRYENHLWSFHLQYFDYALDLAWAFRLSGQERFLARLLELTESWIDASAMRRGDAWAPYVVSVRVANWIGALVLLDDAIPPLSREKLTSSIVAQVAWLERNLEFDLLGNHLIKNARALIFAGSAFEGPAAEGWRRTGRELLLRELLEQFAPDGSHVERSPMYHRICLQDSLEALSLLRREGFTLLVWLRDRLGRGLEFARYMTQPDATPRLFNDSVDGQGPALEQLSTMIRHLLGEVADASPSAVWRAGGFFAFHDQGVDDTLVVDCGAPSPAYQPGHAHCGLLSFTWDIGGQPVIVDSGVHGYGGDWLREYARSTRAHNTLSIDGLEQSELWGVFRVARRAEVRRIELADAPDRWALVASYAPYHNRSMEHERRFERTGPGEWRVTDEVRGAPGAALTSFLHLHPSLQTQIDGDRVLASNDELSVIIEPFGFAAVTVERGAHDPIQGWYCPRFGQALPSSTLVLDARANTDGPVGYVLRSSR